MTDSTILVCFAVKEEAKFFTPRPYSGVAVRRVITGMGRYNAANSIRKALAEHKPGLVVTTGFAGGLNPELKVGTVVYDEDFEADLGKKLSAAGAIPAKFHCSKRVAVSVEQKRELWKTSGADVVEMESSVIRTICAEQRIPSAVVRVISDAANEDLPLDFNALMTSDDRINYFKLAWTLVKSPRKIPQLVKFQEQTMMASRRLGEVLEKSIYNLR